MSGVDTWIVSANHQQYSYVCVSVKTESKHDRNSTQQTKIQPKHFSHTAPVHVLSFRYLLTGLAVLCEQ